MFRVKRAQPAFTERRTADKYEKSTVRLTSVGLAQARPNKWTAPLQISALCWVLITFTATIIRVRVRVRVRVRISDISVKIFSVLAAT